MPSEIVLIADPRILAIPVTENQEPLVDVKNLNTLIYGPSPEIPDNTDYTKMRKTVYEKLMQAQTLLPAGIKFCLYEAYRSLDLQKILFDNRFEKIKRLHPSWNDHQLFEETIKLVSPIINEDGSMNIPPHSTGSAIDVYLIDDQGHAVEMGIHPKDWTVDTDGSFSLTSSEKISAETKKNREIMSNALSKVGFTNYPTEYWHWSYGDRYWAYQNKQSNAIYDSV